MLGLVAAGVVSLSTNTVLADEECYTSGPLDNTSFTADTSYNVTVLNNDSDAGDDIYATVVAFELPPNASKVTLPGAFLDTTVTVPYLSSALVSVAPLTVNNYEVQVKLKGEDPQNVFLGGAGDVNPANRLVDSEWSRMDCDHFNKP
jgi:hypothetical protein